MIIYTFLIVLFLALFFLGLQNGCTASDLLKSSAKSINDIRSVLINFALIGMFSGILRLCGTIACIISLCKLLGFGILLLPAIFIICSAMSFFTGSAFATSATIGVICAALGQDSGIPAPFYCGAILSGIYFGDRISPLSGSANLISGICKINLFVNIKKILKTTIFPFIICVGLYTILGLTTDTTAIGSGFVSSKDTIMLIDMLPILVILLGSVLRLNSKTILTIAIGIGLYLSIFVHRIQIHEAISTLIVGYHSLDASSIPNGGGIISMLKAGITVALSACCVGLLDQTGYIVPIRDFIKSLTIPNRLKYTLVSIIGSMIASNQTLSIMLTHATIDKSTLSGEDEALLLENTSVLLPALIPWNTAFSVPAAAINATVACLPFAFFIYIVPLFYVANYDIHRNKETLIKEKSPSERESHMPI